MTSTDEHRPYQPTSRRPIAEMFRYTARTAVQMCLRYHIKADTVSYASLVASGLAALCFYFAERWPLLLLIGPLLCCLRLWFNMLDGMVAIAAGAASRRGEILNDLPDRFSDVIVFVAVAESGLCRPSLAYWAAIAAVLTAYVGTLSQAVGATRQYGGWMAKPWRMVVLLVGSWVTWLYMVQRGDTRAAFSMTPLDWACTVILIGCIQTVAVRLRRTMKILDQSSSLVSTINNVEIDSPLMLGKRDVTPESPVTVLKSQADCPHRGKFCMLNDASIFEEIAPRNGAETIDLQRADSLPARQSPAAQFAARLRSVSSLVVRGYLSTYHRLDIVGRERLPARGPFMMVSNHSSHLDAICLRAALPRQRLAASFTAVAEDYFMASLFRRTAARVFANAVPFSRDLRVRGGMRRCLSLLSGDNAVLIFFPEGTRTTTGALGAFRPGIGALLAGSSLPVVPCAISGAFAAWPKGKRIARPRSITVTIGQPRTYAAFPRNHQSHRAVSDDLRSAVEAMLCN